MTSTLQLQRRLRRLVPAVVIVIGLLLDQRRRDSTSRGTRHRQVETALQTRSALERSRLSNRTARWRCR